MPVYAPPPLLVASSHSTHMPVMLMTSGKAVIITSSSRSRLSSSSLRIRFSRLFIFLPVASKMGSGEGDLQRKGGRWVGDTVQN